MPGSIRCFALAALALASCTQHADGTCLWVPGDDGTCGGRGGGGSSDPPPPHISFAVAAIAPGRVFVIQRGDDDEALLDASLDVRGLPTDALAPSRIPVRGTLATWPSPDGVSLATMTSYHGAPYGTELALLEGGRLRSLGRLADTIPYQVAAVFDGEAFVVAWSEFTYAEERYRLQVARVFVDGTVTAAIEPIRYGADDQNGRFGLATDGVGGVLLTRPVRRGWRLSPSVPLELEAVRLRDGAVTGGVWVFAADAATGAGCLGDGHALLAAADGYRLLTTRRPCVYTGDPPTLVELRLDPEVAWVAEAPSPLALAELPSTWIAGPGGFLAHDRGSAWRVDAALTTATPAWTADALEELTAAGATATGYVLGLRAWGDDARVDLRLVDGAATDRVTVATDFDLPDYRGCAVGGGGPATIAALPLLLVWRRRRDPRRARP